MSPQRESDEAPGTERYGEIGKSTRRTFLSRLAMAGLAASANSGAAAMGQGPLKELPLSAKSKDAVPVTLRVNGKKYDLRIDPRTTLLDCLREHLHLTGTKKGCDHGQCGACTVHVNGRRVNACLCFAAMYQDDDITTIEGLGQPGNLHAMQAAFVSHDAYQCGYCTSGQIMSAVALLEEPCGPDDAEVKEFMSGNICRCGAYQNIVSAIQSVRQTAKTHKSA
jgi:xanthine dehydrogenase YagT iron-sulfur-binding subunit